MAGTLTLADYDGMQINATRTTIYNTKIDQAMSGAEVRVIWGTSPRYRYSIEIIAQEANDEATTLADFIEDQYGSGDSFTLATDPVTGQNVTVRFESPPRFEQYRISGWWSVKMEMISVL